MTDTNYVRMKDGFTIWNNGGDGLPWWVGDAEGVEIAAFETEAEVNAWLDGSSYAKGGIA